eukprot:m.50813 g.50813  ORF g.50813 m.50813 type:complete len:368 (-) comp11190_c1_seq3:42-1145(-)
MAANSGISSEAEDALRRMTMDMRTFSVSKPAAQPPKQYGTCASCQTPIVGEDSGIQIGQYSCHKACALCCVCSKEIGFSGDIFGEYPKLYCSTHRLMDVYTCHACRGTIQNKVIKVAAVDSSDVMSFHPSCLKCEECEAILTGGSVMVTPDKQQRLLCAPCSKIREQAHMIECSVCHYSIQGTYVSVPDSTGSLQPRHPQCFTCAACGVGLQGQPFVPESSNLTLCKPCHLTKTAPVCSGCKQPILPTTPGDDEIKYTKVEDQCFHESCLTCKHCGCNFETPQHGPYIRTDEAGLFCSEHAVVVHAVQPEEDGMKSRPDERSSRPSSTLSPTYTVAKEFDYELPEVVTKEEPLYATPTEFFLEEVEV